jgi:lipoprotein-anchoring transpeptidase ErfK/SrfK
MALSVLLALPAAATAAAPAAAPTIQPGVSAGGVDLSGLTVEQAAAKLSATLDPVLAGDVIVGAGGKVFRLRAVQAKEKLDALLTAKRAAQATSAGAVPLALTHSSAAVRDFVIAVGRKVSHPARNATVRVTLRHIFRRAGRNGYRLAEAQLRTQIEQALDTLGAPRVFHVHLTPTKPKVGLRQLARGYPTVITIDRGHFKLRIFKRLRFLRSYGIAVGRSGLATPTGLYRVQERETNPSWHVPNSSWAGALAGTTVPPGPNDPIKARWLGLGGGVGIHGTAESFSIGSRASHGCIRMLIPDVIALYRITPLGTPVLIK